MRGRQDTAVTITTRELSGEIGLLSWLPVPRGVLCWVNGDDGLAAWGEAARFTARGAARFAQVQRWWTAFTARAVVHDELGVRGSGPVAFASMAFADDPGDSVLIVPRVVVGRQAGVHWITTVGGPVPARQPVTAPRGVRFQPGMVDDAAHRRSVAAAVSRIRAGEAGEGGPRARPDSHCQRAAG
jgi:menaquinone-specific isochorismate synthase